MLAPFSFLVSVLPIVISMFDNLDMEAKKVFVGIID